MTSKWCNGCWTGQALKIFGGFDWCVAICVFIVIVSVFVNERKRYKTIRDDCEPICLKRWSAGWVLEFHNCKQYRDYWQCFATHTGSKVFDLYKLSTETVLELTKCLSITTFSQTLDKTLVDFWKYFSSISRSIVFPEESKWLKEERS